MSFAIHSFAACLALAPGMAAWAQSGLLCASDSLASPHALQERFINADCESCWRMDSPVPAKGTLVLDWVIPGSKGDDAPLAAVARPESLERLDFLRLPAPGAYAQRSSAVQGGQHHVLVERGPVLNGYVGASLTFDSSVPLQAPLTGWLALVEMLPAGTEGSPVARVLMRNLLSDTIAARNTEIMGQLWRPMNVPEGARPDRLQLLGWVSDAQGNVLAAAQSSCGKATETE